MSTHTSNRNSNRIMSTKRITIVLGLILVATIAYIGFQDAVRTWQNLQNQKQQIETLNTEYKKLDQELDHTKESKQKSQEEVQKLEEEKNKLEQERQRLEKELQAKAEAKAKLAASSSRVINAATATQTASALSGNCSTWLAQAGITHPIAVDLITRESGCNPCAYNPGQSDCNYKGNAACGIPQALPCSKLRDTAGCAMTDAVCQLRWMQSYVYGRYGSWEAAKEHHDRMGWY